MEELVVITFTKNELKELIKECVSECLNERNQSSEAHQDIEKPMSIKEVSEFLNLSVQTIYGYTFQNLIPYSKRGKKLYFNREEIIKWIKEGRRKTLAEIEVEAENYIWEKKMRKRN